MPRVRKSTPIRLSVSVTATLLAGITALAPVAAFAQARQPQRPPAQQQQQQPAQQAPQQQGGPTLVQVKPEPSQTDWTKVCGKDPANNKEICYTTRDFVSDQGQPVLALAIYDVKGDPTRIVRFLMPLGLLLRPGIRFTVDQGQPTPGAYAICFPNGCFAEAQVKDDFINSVKKGNTLNVSVQNQVGNEVTFAVPLAGFTKAFDGAPIDPKVLEEQQRKLQEELQKRSEEMRKNMEQQGAATGAVPAPGMAPAPAAPAPAAPAAPAPAR
ncbi:MULTISPECIES: invasion associated locus B family protein [unclassified Chelatococcus]|uniref:invasion associated locus B family protein n=1 Tax=unclassified Chelatococcus TaxID=2638111 RepID=UPI001BCF0595|nr:MULTISPECIES: invasion associated locus B family protein [unclassified Chelatococcus]MBS7695662.1 invasion associated locus B family protein [Chelatococcus sp. YT9]MBX3557945.1 invasion associated locus B family protein [Chelatococcus sp.]